MQRRDLISDEYLADQRWLHAQPRGYGAKGARWADTVHRLARDHPVRDAILDYGCGQNSLVFALLKRGLRARGYDPAVPEYDSPPLPADMVVCTDVLEHCEPAKVAAVLVHIASLTRHVAFFVIALQPGNKFLPDGRDAHILLQPATAWLTQVCEAFGDKFELTVLADPDGLPSIKKRTIFTMSRKA